MTNMLGTIWTEWFKVWEARNEYVHGKTKTKKQERKRGEIEQKIRETYKDQDKYLPSGQGMLEDDVEEFSRSKGYSALTNWERVWRPLFAQSAVDCRLQALRGFHFIPIYLKPATSSGCQARGLVSLLLD